MTYEKLILNGCYIIDCCNKQSEFTWFNFLWSTIFLRLCYKQVSFLWCYVAFVVTVLVFAQNVSPNVLFLLGAACPNYWIVFWLQCCCSKQVFLGFVCLWQDLIKKPWLTGTWSVDKATLKFMVVLMPLPLRCWDNRCVLPLLAWTPGYKGFLHPYIIWIWFHVCVYSKLL